MVHSASSVEALQEAGSSTYFLVRQLINMAIGLAFILITCIAPAFSLESYRYIWTKPFWVIIMGLLVLVKAIGAGSGGAVRWIDLGFTTISSEFAKPVAIIIAARLAVDILSTEKSILQKFIKGLVLGIGLPLALGSLLSRTWAVPSSSPSRSSLCSSFPGCPGAISSTSSALSR